MNMDNKIRVFHVEYGQGTIVDRVFRQIGQKQAKLVKFDSMDVPKVIVEEDLRPYTPELEEYVKIMHMDGKILVEKFEEIVRGGAGPDYIRLVWIRNEILKRIAGDKT